MFDAKYASILPYVDDYHLHLIVPSEISDFELFKTSLREVLEFIKVSNDEAKIEEVINKNPAYKKLENDAVSAINVFTGIQLSVDKEGGKSICAKVGMIIRNQEWKKRDRLLIV